MKTKTDQRTTIANRISELIKVYLKHHPEIKGMRGLAAKTGLSYDSLQKYARGSSVPPKGKLKLLLDFVEPGGDSQERSNTLFDSSKDLLESGTMPPGLS